MFLSSPLAPPLSVSFCLAQSTLYSRSHCSDNSCFLFPLLLFPLALSCVGIIGFYEHLFYIGVIFVLFVFACLLREKNCKPEKYMEF